MQTSLFSQAHRPYPDGQPDSGNIFSANLSAGANAGKFPNGVNQLFRQGLRLRLGRWPNLGTENGGYSTIDGQPANNRISDNELPAGDWSGAVAHIKGMRWYILNREVTGSASHSLTVGENLDCWGGNCTGWGYFLNNHLNTLDQDGEWYYDPASQRLYLYSTAGMPADGQIEGSVILKTDDRSWGGITLGEDLGVETAYVVIENFALRGWFRHGIATPTNLAHYEIHDLIIQNNTIRDVDSTGINLGTWVYDAWDGRPDGWRGGYNLTIQENTILRANRMGIDSYARQSTISGNTIQDVGLIENLGAAGMGCDYSAGGGLCTEDGDGIRIKVDQADDTGNNMLISGNHLERIAYNGMDIFGHHNTLEHNVIRQACYAKGDCGGVRTFGSDNMSNTSVHDLLFDENLILNTSGNTDGCNTTYREEFGFGLYIDHNSRRCNHHRQHDHQLNRQRYPVPGFDRNNHEQHAVQQQPRDDVLRSGDTDRLSNLCIPAHREHPVQPPGYGTDAFRRGQRAPGDAATITIFSIHTWHSTSRSGTHILWQDGRHPAVKTATQGMPGSACPRRTPANSTHILQRHIGNESHRPGLCAVSRSGPKPGLWQPGLAALSV